MKYYLFSLCASTAIVCASMPFTTHVVLESLVLDLGCKQRCDSKLCSDGNVTALQMGW
jgi:hypothetical protein